jgi:hypothetical protein
MKLKQKTPQWVMWKSSLSRNTCKACSERHGKFYDKNEPIVRPPLHPNCSCQLVSVTANSEKKATTSQAEPPSLKKKVVPKTTSPPKNEKEPESIPDGGVYGKVKRRSFGLFSGGTPLRIRATVESAFSSINKLLGVIPYSSKSHYEHNKELSFDGKYIKNQHSDEASKVKMGIAPISSNACGWVSVYNAFVSLGAKVHPAEIVNYIENNNGLIARGAFGVNPLVFDRLFTKYGVKSTTTLFQDALHIIPELKEMNIPLEWLPNTPRFNLARIAIKRTISLDAYLKEAGVRPDQIAQKAVVGDLPTAKSVNLDRLAKEGRTLILTYYNNKNNISDGAHYVNVKWDEKIKKYTVWNVDEAIPNTFESINSFLDDNNLGLISMTVIH